MEKTKKLLPILIMVLILLALVLYGRGDEGSSGLAAVFLEYPPPIPAYI